MNIKDLDPQTAFEMSVEEYNDNRTKPLKPGCFRVTMEVLLPTEDAPRLFTVQYDYATEIIDVELKRGNGLPIEYIGRKQWEKMVESLGSQIR